MKNYRVNDIFFSLQGEGVRCGTANVFVRLSGCNQQCRRETHGFDCDTEFTSGTNLTATEIIQRAKHLAPNCHWIILTGGEPALQTDTELLKAMHDASYNVAIETNGSIKLPPGIDWICVSPKVAEHALRQTTANEVKYVRRHGQGIPKTKVASDYYLLSPAFNADQPDPQSLQWCIQLALQNPPWRLSIQQHKGWQIA